MRTTAQPPARPNGLRKDPMYEQLIDEQPIRTQLRQCLFDLNYHAFAQCLCLLLARIGYEAAHVAGRTHWKGRNCEGGYDIEAYLPGGVGQRKVIVQIKQFDTLPVYQRSVDELRGTCLRAGAAEALLITTSTFSPIIQQNAAVPAAPVAPVRLLDGEELLDMLILHHIGVWEEDIREEVHNPELGGAESRHNKERRDEPGLCIGKTRRIGLDTAFFEELSRMYAGNARRSKEKPALSRRPSWLLTVRLDLAAVTRKKARKEGH